MQNWKKPLKSPRCQESKRLPGHNRDDISWNTQQRGKRNYRDHMEKLGTAPGWEMGSPTLLKSINPEFLLSKGNTGTKCTAEIEGKAIQRLPHLGIHPICSYQTHSLLLMPRSACWQEPDMDVSWKALPETYQYRYGCLQPTIGLSTGASMEELGQGLKELKMFAQFQPTISFRTSRD